MQTLDRVIPESMLKCALNNTAIVTVCRPINDRILLFVAPTGNTELAGSQFAQ